MAYRTFSARSLNEADVIIIGSGASGLVLGSLLTNSDVTGAAPRKVMVLEAHTETPGGCLHHFKIEGGDGFDFASGIHYTSAASVQSRAIFDLATNFKIKVEHEKRDEVFDTYTFPPGAKREPIALSAGNFEQVVGVHKKRFKDLMKGLVFIVFIKLLNGPLAFLVWCYYVLSGWRKELCQNFDNWYRREARIPAGKPTPEVAWIARGDHGMPRDSCPAIAQGCIFSHYCDGVSHWDVQGAVREMCKAIKAAGGEVLIQAKVEKFIIENGKCKGVVVDGHEILAREAVVNCAGVWAGQEIMRNTRGFEKTGLPEWGLALEVGPSVTHGCIFLEFKGMTSEEIGLPHGNIWHNDIGGAENSFFLSHHKSELGMHAFIIYEIDHYARGPEYEDKKERLTSKYLKMATEMFPGLKRATAMDSSSPASTAQWLHSWKGCSYGLSLNARRFSEFQMLRALRPRTSIDGLLLGNSDTLLFGVFGAINAPVTGPLQVLIDDSFIGCFKNNMAMKVIRVWKRKTREREAKSAVVAGAAAAAASETKKDQ